jgi:hypothetical protein
MNDFDIGLVLEAIRKNTDFRLKFSTIADEIVDKVYTFYKNENCTCRSTIVNWIKSNQAKVEELINSFKTLFENLKQTAAPVAPTAQVPVAEKVAAPVQAPVVASTTMKIGSIEVIERTPQAYASLFDKIKQERWVFRGLNVAPMIQDGKEVWFVFFY